MLATSGCQHARSFPYIPSMLKSVLHACLCRYGLFGLHWISEVNGIATPDLDTLLQVIRPLKDGDDARVKMVHLETASPKVI